MFKKESLLGPFKGIVLFKSIRNSKRRNKNTFYVLCKKTHTSYFAFTIVIELKS